MPDIKESTLYNSFANVHGPVKTLSKAVNAFLPDDLTLEQAIEDAEDAMDRLSLLRRRHEAQALGDEPALAHRTVHYYDIKIPSIRVPIQHDDMDWPHCEPFVVNVAVQVVPECASHHHLPKEKFRSRFTAPQVWIRENELPSWDPRQQAYDKQEREFARYDPGSAPDTPEGYGYDPDSTPSSPGIWPPDRPWNRQETTKRDHDEVDSSSSADSRPDVKVSRLDNEGEDDDKEEHVDGLDEEVEQRADEEE